MALVTPNVGEVVLLDNLLKDSNGENWTLKLYKTDVTPSQSSVAADFTVADFTGYSNKTLTRASWGAASTVTNKASASYAQQTWTSSGSSQTIYGVYIVGATSGILIYAEKFATARTLVSGDQLSYTPVFTLNSEN